MAANLKEKNGALILVEKGGLIAGEGHRLIAVARFLSHFGIVGLPGSGTAPFGLVIFLAALFRIADDSRVDGVLADGLAIARLGQMGGLVGVRNPAIFTIGGGNDVDAAPRFGLGGVFALGPRNLAASGSFRRGEAIFIAAMVRGT